MRSLNDRVNSVSWSLKVAGLMMDFWGLYKEEENYLSTEKKI